MIMMIRRSIFGSISQYQYQYLHNSTICSSSATNPPPPPPLSRVATLVEGCDYEHWLVVVEPPKGYPLRTQILNDYIKTLAIALGSEEEAKKSIYSVSTKYYYAFGCKIPENLTHKIKSLPNVRWVLPDSYLCHSENDYGGEPFVEGEVVSYDERYHADWLRDKNDCKCQNRTRSRKARRKKEREKKLMLYKQDFCIEDSYKMICCSVILSFQTTIHNIVARKFKNITGLSFWMDFLSENSRWIILHWS